MADRASPFTIRPFRPGDLRATVDLWYDSWHTAFPDVSHYEPKDEWRRRFETEIVPAEQVYVAEIDGRVAGFLAVKDVGGGHGFLHLIFIAPDLQRLGIGSALVSLAKQMAPAGLRLHALQRNAAAAAFYEAHGFRAGATGLGRVGLPDVEFAWTPDELGESTDGQRAARTVH